MIFSMLHSYVVTNDVQTKKKEDAVGLSPMETAEKEVTDLIKQWSKGSFTVNRQLYCNQESLCAVVEKSIWVRMHMNYKVRTITIVFTVV